MVAHAVHFVAVTRYAVRTGGRTFFPGGRSLQDVGGWRTVAGIYGAFAGLALTGSGSASARPPGPDWSGGRGLNR